MIDYSKENGSNKGYAIVAVDVYSRKVRAVIIQTKSEKSITEGLRIIFKDATPKKIHCDEESGIKYNKFLKDNSVTVYHTAASHANMAERAIQTIKHYVEKKRGETLFRNWKVHLSQIVTSINTTINKTIGMTPDEAQHMTDKQNIANIEKLESNIKQRPNSTRYKIGDYVVTVKEKGIFHKGYKKRWNDVPHVIEYVFGYTPVRYRIADLTKLAYDAHLYYHEELQKISVADKERLVDKYDEPVRVASRPTPKPIIEGPGMRTRSKSKK